VATVRDRPSTPHGERSTVGSWMSSLRAAFLPVDRFCVSAHTVEEADDELDVSAAASGEAELPQFCGGTVVMVECLIRSIGVDLAGAVAVDLCPCVAEKPGRLRFVVGGHAFTRGAALGFRGHDRDGTVFQWGRPSARAHQPISRDGCDRQSSHCATLISEAEQPERRLGMSIDPIGIFHASRAERPFQPLTVGFATDRL